MSTPTTIRVVATSDRGVFIGLEPAEDEYCIFELGDTREVSVGHRLTGDFHGHSASTFTARNLTTGDTPRIDLLDWELTLVRAVERCMSMRSATKFIIGHKVIMAHSDDVVSQLLDEIRRV